MLIVKHKKENLARKLFNGIKIKTTSTDACHLGITVGSEKFKQEYVKMKVKKMTEELEKLSKKRTQNVRTSCSISCIDTWLETQVDLFIKDNSWYTSAHEVSGKLYKILLHSSHYKWKHKMMRKVYSNTATQTQRIGNSKSCYRC